MQDLDPKRIQQQSVRLRRLAVAIVGDSLADDVLQDVWLAALQQSSGASADSPAWLSRVTRNLAWRKRIGDSRRRAREEGNSVSEASDTLEGIVSRIEQGHLVERTLLTLAEPFRSTLLWHYYEDLSITEISRRSGRPESTTRTHLQRGLEQLRERLKSEHGREWISALLPLLRSEHTAPVSAGGLGGLLIMTLSKPILILSALLATWFGYEHLAAGEGEPLTIAQPMTNATQVDTARVERPETRVREPQREDITPEADEIETTPAKIIDESSRLGMAGLRVQVEWDGNTFELEADKQGIVSLPFDVPSPIDGFINVERDVRRVGHPLSRRMQRGLLQTFLRAELVPSNPSAKGVRLGVQFSDESAAIEFQLKEVRTAWVRMPFAPNESELETLYASLRVDDGKGGSLAGGTGRHGVVLSRGTDLLFICAEEGGHLGTVAPAKKRWKLNISLDESRSYGALMPAQATWTDPPCLAEPQYLVEQQVRVHSRSTGQPVKGVIVSAYGTEDGGTRIASGFTNEHGRVTLDNLPPGMLKLRTIHKAFEFNSIEAFVEGGTTLVDLDILEIPGTSDLSLTIKFPPGPKPAHAFAQIFSLPLKNSKGSSVLDLKPLQAGGWSAELLFPDLAEGEHGIQISTNLPGLGASELIPVTMPSAPLTITLASSPPCAPLRIEFPKGVEQADFWIWENDGSSSQIIGASANSQVACVALHRRPRTWLIASEGYLPVFGRQDAWTLAQDSGGEAYFNLAPNFEKGEGLAVRVLGVEMSEQAALRFPEETPLAGTMLLDPRTRTLLATTDESGFAILRDAQPSSEVLVVAEGYVETRLMLSDSALTRCALPR